MNNPFADIGEIIMMPYKDETYIDKYDIISSIENIIERLELKNVNIVGCNESSIFFMPDFINSINNKFTVKSVNIMKDYKIINIAGHFHRYENTIILHDGIGLDTQQMNLRIFSTIPFLKTKPTYITMFKSEHSHYNVLDISPKEYVGYGKYEQKYESHDQNLIKIIS